MPITDELLTVYKMNATNYAQGARLVTSSTGGIAASLSSVVSPAGVATAALAVVTAGVAAVGVALNELKDFAIDAFKEFGKQDAMERGLKAVLGDAVDLNNELRELREIAKLPGLNFQDALRGETRLVAAGLSATDARKTLEAFGNAIATVGGSSADLQGVSVALTQILSKGKVSAEEILQLQERLPQIRSAMQAAFGTADTERLQQMGIDARSFVRAITTEFAKMPKVVGGAQNALENLDNALQQAKISFAQGFSGDATSGIERLSDTLDALTESGVFAELGKAIPAIFGSTDAGSMMRDLVVYTVAGAQTLADIAQSIRAGFEITMAKLDAFANSIVDLFNALPGPDIPHFSATKALLSPTPGPLGDPVRMFNAHVKELNSTLAQSDQEQAMREFFPWAFGGDKSQLDVIDPGKQTASNTAKLVQIQERMLDFHRQVLGGGDLAAKELDAATLAGMSARSRRFANHVGAIIDGYESRVIDMLRRNGRAR